MHIKTDKRENYNEGVFEKIQKNISEKTGYTAAIGVSKVEIPTNVSERLIRMQGMQ